MAKFETMRDEKNSSYAHNQWSSRDTQIYNQMYTKQTLNYCLSNFCRYQFRELWGSTAVSDPWDCSGTSGWTCRPHRERIRTMFPLISTTKKCQGQPNNLMRWSVQALLLAIRNPSFLLAAAIHWHTHAIFISSDLTQLHFYQHLMSLPVSW